MGWLMKLDTAGNVLWEKFGERFNRLDAMAADNGGLFLIGAQDVIKIDREGNEQLRLRLPPGADHKFIHPVGEPAKVRIDITLSTLKSEIVDFDLNLHAPLHTTHLDNVLPGLIGSTFSEHVVTLFGICRPYRHANRLPRSDRILQLKDTRAGEHRRSGTRSSCCSTQGRRYGAKSGDSTERSAPITRVSFGVAARALP